MSQRLRWGILGTGNIARQFAADMAGASRGDVIAVGSRSITSARDFATTFHTPQAAGGYEQLLANPDVDAVYISLPNSMHHEWAIKALSAGKHVLCEKPIGASAAEAQEMFDVSRKTGRLLVEAFMYRAHPLTNAVVDEVKKGAIGNLKLIRTSFCFRTTRVEGNVRFNADLAGGALMDVGCYCINFALLHAGAEPAQVSAIGHLHKSGVDDYSVGQMCFANGIISSFTCGMTLHTDNTAYLCGDEGYIEVPIPWKPPAQSAAYVIAKGSPPRMDGAKTPAPQPAPKSTRLVDAAAPLYAVEADAFAATVLDSAAPFMPEHQSLAAMKILDQMRKQIGVTANQ